MLKNVLTLLVILGWVLMGALYTGCAGTSRTVVVYRYREAAVPYAAASLPQQRLCGPGTVYSCPPRVVPYYDGYRAPVPQYGPYGYSAAMTARVTPPVYVQASPARSSSLEPRRVVVRTRPRRSR